MLFLLICTVLGASKIKLKIVGDDKFLGVSGDKLTKVEYRDALSIRLNTRDNNISEKVLEGRENKALTEAGWWFFPKSYSFKKKDNGDKQAFRIVYYAPNEYLIMKGDSCLGFKDNNKFKRVDCKLKDATRFRMCTNRICDSYVDLMKELSCIKGMLSSQGLNGGPYGNPYGNPFGGMSGKPYYGLGFDGYEDSGYRNRFMDDSSTDDSDYRKNKRRNRKGHRSGRHRQDASTSTSDTDNDGYFSSCKSYKYGIPGYNASRSPDYGFGRDQPLYGPHDKALGRFGFPYTC